MMGTTVPRGCRSALRLPVKDKALVTAQPGENKLAEVCYDLRRQDLHIQIQHHARCMRNSPNTALIAIRLFLTIWVDPISPPPAWYVGHEKFVRLLGPVEIHLIVQPAKDKLGIDESVPSKRIDHAD